MCAPPSTKSASKGVYAFLWAALNAASAFVLKVPGWLSTQFNISLGVASGLSVLSFVGAGLVMIQVDEYLAADACWAIAALVVVAKGIQKSAAGAASFRRVFLVGVHVAAAIVLMIASLRWTESKRAGRPWTSYVDMTFGIDVDHFRYCDFPKETPELSVDWKPDMPTQVGNFWIQGPDGYLFGLNAMLHTTITYNGTQPIRIESLKVEMHCDGPWTKVESIVTPFRKLLFVRKTGDWALRVDYDDLFEKLEAYAIQPKTAVSGWIFVSYPRTFVCDSREPHFRLKIKDSYGNERLISARSGASVQNNLIPFRTILGITDERSNVSGMQRAYFQTALPDVFIPW